MMSIAADRDPGGRSAAGPTLSVRGVPWVGATPVAILVDAPEAAQGELWVHDLLGRRPCRLGGEAWSAGRHEALWDGRDSAGRAVVAGVYLVRFGTGSQAPSRAVLLLRAVG
jgi:hypothetical protein